MNTTARQRPASLIPVGVTWAAVAAVVFSLSVACLLGVRRLADALVEPLPPTGLLLVGAVIAGLGMVVRRLITLDGIRGWWRIGLHTAMSAAVVGIGVSLSVPGTNGGALGVFWLLLAVEEGIGWGGLRRSVAPQTQRHEAILATELVEQKRDVGESHGAVPVGLGDASADPAVVHQLTRRRTVEGTDELSGWLRVEFLSGQRTEHAHLAFCPAFDHVPRLAVEQTDGPRARIKTAQLLPYGARLDLKLSSPVDAKQRVTLRITAVEEPMGYR